MHPPDFAFRGGSPAFKERIAVGQRYFPDAARFDAAMAGIFERQYYTEFGPLNRQVEATLQATLNVAHAICVATDSIGLLMATDAMMIEGNVIVPSMATAAAAAVECCGLQPVFCDMHPATLQLDVRHVERLIDDRTAAILGAHLWGGACDIEPLSVLAQAAGIELYFDGSHAFGCQPVTLHSLARGRATIFSFGQDNIVNAGEGACICTNDDVLAARLRVMRASSGVREPADVNRTVNGRFSELQAALAQMSIADFDANRRHNESLFRRYGARLAKIPGLRLLPPQGVAVTNYQAAICRLDEPEFGLSLDQLVPLLAGENIEARRLPASGTDLPNSAAFARTCFQLPLGARVSENAVDTICRVLSAAHDDVPRPATVS